MPAPLGKAATLWARHVVHGLSSIYGPVLIQPKLPANLRWQPRSFANTGAVSSSQATTDPLIRWSYDQRPQEARLMTVLPPHPPHHYDQSVFRPKDKLSFQIVRISHHFSRGLDNSKSTLTCYYDLPKAFGKVWHKALLMKLTHPLVQGSALEWL